METHCYQYMCSVDEGAYGTVCACAGPTGELVAVKSCKKWRDSHVSRAIFREIRVLQALPPHPCVIALMDAFRCKSSGQPHLVFELMERSLHQELGGLAGQRLDANTLKATAWQLVLGLAHCHQHKVVHRDVKPANVLLSGHGPRVAAKLSDFGFARFMEGRGAGAREPLSSYVMTRWYRAPEVISREEYGMPSDIWSLGCTLAEAATGEVLFPGTSSIDQLARIMKCCKPREPGSRAKSLLAEPLLSILHPPPTLSRVLAKRLPHVEPVLVDVIAACLALDPLERPSAASILQMPYFHDVPRLLAAADRAELLPFAERAMAAEAEAEAARAAADAAKEQAAVEAAETKPLAAKRREEDGPQAVGRSSAGSPESQAKEAKLESPGCAPCARLEGSDVDVEAEAAATADGSGDGCAAASATGPVGSSAARLQRGTCLGDTGLEAGGAAAQEERPRGVEGPQVADGSRAGQLSPAHWATEVGSQQVGPCVEGAAGEQPRHWASDAGENPKQTLQPSGGAIARSASDAQLYTGSAAAASDARGCYLLHGGGADVRSSSSRSSRQRPARSHPGGSALPYGPLPQDAPLAPTEGAALPATTAGASLPAQAVQVRRLSAAASRRSVAPDAPHQPSASSNMLVVRALLSRAANATGVGEHADAHVDPGPGRCGVGDAAPEKRPRPFLGICNPAAGEPDAGPDSNAAGSDLGTSGWDWNSALTSTNSGPASKGSLTPWVTLTRPMSLSKGSQAAGGLDAGRRCATSTSIPVCTGEPGGGWFLASSMATSTHGSAQGSLPREGGHSRFRKTLGYVGEEAEGSEPSISRREPALAPNCTAGDSRVLWHNVPSFATAAEPRPECPATKGGLQQASDPSFRGFGASSRTASLTSLRLHLESGGAASAGLWTWAPPPLPEAATFVQVRPRSGRKSMRNGVAPEAAGSKGANVEGTRQTMSYQRLNQTGRVDDDSSSGSEVRGKVPLGRRISRALLSAVACRVRTEAG